MLLNQCLAISLSPTSSNQGASRYEDEEAEKNKPTSGEEKALLLFHQLIEQNRQRAKSAQDYQVIHTEGQQIGIKELSNALERVEFAGFVVPSWLLLSGSFNDLQCLKSSWSAGNFKSPDGFKIETIGK